MTRPAFLVFLPLIALGLAAQQRPARPAATVKVATLDGKPMTAGDLRTLLRNSPPAFLPRLREDPKETLRNFQLSRKLSDDARAAGLHNQFPYKQSLEWQSAGALMNAQLEAMLEAVEIPETEIRAYYDKHIPDYRTMQALAIRVLNATAGGDTKARAIAEEVVKQARAGVSFGELGNKYSSEPDLAQPGNANTITPSFDLPEAAKTRLFATLPGQVTDPIQMKDSYVIFRVESLKARPLAEVRADIKAELQQQRSGSELERVQKGIQVKVLMPQFFAANAPNPVPGAPEADSIDRAAPVAEVNGKTITAREMYESMMGMTPTARQSAAADPQQFLLQSETIRVLAAEARKAGLDRKPPASDLIFWTADNVLMQAQVDEKTKSITSTLQEQQDYYKTNENLFRGAQTKLIYVPFSVSPPPGSKQRNEEQAMARAREAAQKFRSGGDYKALVSEYSEEPDSKARGGDMGLRYADPNLPALVRDAIFGAKDGELAGPVRLPNGIYLFLVEKHTMEPFSEVRDDIYKTLSNEKFRKWFDDYRGQINVTIDDEAALKAELAYH